MNVEDCGLVRLWQIETGDLILETGNVTAKDFSNQGTKTLRKILLVYTLCLGVLVAITGLIIFTARVDLGLNRNRTDTRKKP